MKAFCKLALAIIVLQASPCTAEEENSDQTEFRGIYITMKKSDFIEKAGNNFSIERDGDKYTLYDKRYDKSVVSRCAKVEFDREEISRMYFYQCYFNVSNTSMRSFAQEITNKYGDGKGMDFSREVENTAMGRVLVERFTGYANFGEKITISQPIDGDRDAFMIAQFEYGMAYEMRVEIPTGDFD